MQLVIKHVKDTLSDSGVRVFISAKSLLLKIKIGIDFSLGLGLRLVFGIEKDPGQRCYAQPFSQIY